MSLAISQPYFARSGHGKMILRAVTTAIASFIVVACDCALSAESTLVPQNQLQAGMTQKALTVTQSAANRSNTNRFSAVSDDGRYVAITTTQQVRVIEYATGKLMLDANFPDEGLRQTAISPSGDRLYVSGKDGGKLWDIPAKSAVPTSSLPWYVSKARFSADGKRLAITSFSTIVAIDCITGQVVGKFQFGRDRGEPQLFDLAFSPDGKKLFAVSLNGIYRLNADSLQPIGEPWLGIGAFNIAFSPDSRRLAATREVKKRMQVVVLDAVTGELLGDPISDFADDDRQQAITFTPDGRHLLTASMRGLVSLWNSTNGALVAQEKLTERYLVGLFFDRNAKRLYSLERGVAWNISVRPDALLEFEKRDARARVLLPTGSHFRDFVPEAGIVASSAAFHSDNGLLVIGGPRVTFVDANALRDMEITVRPAPGPESREDPPYIETLAISHDGRRIAVGPDYKAMGVYDVATGKLVSIIRNSDKYASIYGRLSTFLPDGKLAVVWKDDLSIVNADKGTTIRRLGLKVDGKIAAVGAGARKNVIAVGTSTGALLIVRPGTAAPLIVIDHAHRGALLKVVFDAEDKMIATGGEDGIIRLFDAETGNPIRTPWAAHFDAITALAFSQNGQLVGSGSADGSVRVWNVLTGQAVTYALVGHDEQVLAVVFSPSTGQLLSFGKDSVLRHWDIPATSRPDK